MPGAIVCRSWPNIQRASLKLRGSSIYSRRQLRGSGSSDMVLIAPRLCQGTSGRVPLAVRTGLLELALTVRCHCSANGPLRSWDGRG